MFPVFLNAPLGLFPIVLELLPTYVLVHRPGNFSTIVKTAGVGKSVNIVALRELEEINGG